jgi:hypothetical protein
VRLPPVSPAKFPGKISDNISSIFPKNIPKIKHRIFLNKNKDEILTSLDTDPMDTSASSLLSVRLPMTESRMVSIHLPA